MGLSYCASSSMMVQYYFQESRAGP